MALLLQNSSRLFASSLNNCKTCSYHLIAANFHLNTQLQQQQQQPESNEQQQVLDWKKNVVIVPVQTGPDDIRKSNRLVKDGFYLSHRAYVEKIPEKYTIEPVKVKKTGGYDIETMTRMYKRVGGGLPMFWHFIDYKRVGPKSGPPLVEKVIDIIKSRDRTAYIALVAHGNIKRYILASEGIKVGDMVRTYGELTREPVDGKPGDAHPVGCFSNGTRLHCIEPTPGYGAMFCRAAGSSAIVVNQIDDRVILKLPSNLEISVDKNCMATVGQVSRMGYKDEKLSHPVDTRDLGYRPSSGLWQRKDGYCGRKINPPKPIKVMGQETKTQTERRVPYTYVNWSLTE